MPYSCEHDRKFHKTTAREKNQAVIKECERAISEIITNPGIGDQKKGNARSIYGYGFEYNSTVYRIYYFVHECCNADNCEYEKRYNDGECQGLVKFLFWGTHAEGDRFLAKGKKELQALQNPGLSFKPRDKF